jgi:hypothetical protein
MMIMVKEPKLLFLNYLTNKLGDSFCSSDFAERLKCGT